MSTATLPVRPSTSGTRRPRPILVDRLRGDVRRRPAVDPGLAGGLRAWLEDGVAELAGSLPAGGPPLRMDRRSLGPTPGDRSGPVTTTLVRGAMVGALFRQVVITGRIDDPVDDALAALETDVGNAEVLAVARGLAPAAKLTLHQSVARQAAVMATQWSAVSPIWHPRVADRLSAPLAGGRIVLSGVADLALGVPSDGSASMCLVEVRSGDPSPVHRGDRCFLALLEALRSGAAPFRVATYYPLLADICVEEVTEDLLATTVQEVLWAVDRLAAAGG